MSTIQPSTSEPYRWDRLSDSIRGLLDSLETEGSFSAHGVWEDVNPGLEIEGLGSIGMPISHHDAQRLIQHSRQAPFGKGTETFVDTKVRKTWEIDAAQIRCAHPKWPEIHQSIAESVCRQLGVVNGSTHVELQPYKLLSYDEGAMFKPHKDTEKQRGMIGTVVVCLPSYHEGGDVAVSFNGEHRILQTSVNSSYSTSVLAWYGDVLHEVKPVTKGYRIAMTYNMIHLDSSSSTPGVLNGDPRLAALQNIMKDWTHTIDDEDEDLASDPLPGFLVYMLEHQYTDESLCLSGLKGADYRRVKAVLDIAQAGECDCFLATVEKGSMAAVTDWGQKTMFEGSSTVWRWLMKKAHFSAVL